LSALLILALPTFGHGYFRRVTSPSRNHAFLHDGAESRGALPAKRLAGSRRLTRPAKQE
jgi:hypothetical protein